MITYICILRTSPDNYDDACHSGSVVGILFVVVGASCTILTCPSQSSHSTTISSIRSTSSNSCSRM